MFKRIPFAAGIVGILAGGAVLGVALNDDSATTEWDKPRFDDIEFVDVDDETAARLDDFSIYDDGHKYWMFARRDRICDLDLDPNVVVDSLRDTGVITSDDDEMYLRGLMHGHCLPAQGD